jgi:non-lysosomal glucosylceramidase
VCYIWCDDDDADDDDVQLKPGEARQLTFSLCWDSPYVTFGSGKKLPRRYTKFFGNAGNAVGALCAHTLARRLAWEQAIDAWQRPILDNDLLPSFYK